MQACQLSCPQAGGCSLARREERLVFLGATASKLSPDVRRSHSAARRMSSQLPQTEALLILS